MLSKNKKKSGRKHAKYIKLFLKRKKQKAKKQAKANRVQRE